MANNFYDLGRKYILDGNLQPAVDNISAALISNAYTPNLATDQFYSTPATSLLNSKHSLTSKTTTAGTFDADDVTFAAVTSGATVSYVAIFKDTGTNSTSPLICLFDTISGFPVTTNGGDIIISWNASGIFRL